MWPLKQVEKGSIFTYVVRTLAFPTGKWQFPLRKIQEGGESNLSDSLVPPPELEEIQDEGDWGREGHGGDDVLKTPVEPDPKKRNRSITALRIAVHGASPKCQGCKRFNRFN